MHLLLQHLCVLFIRRNLDTLSSRPAFANIEKDLAAQDFIVERYLKAKQPAQTEAVPRPLKASYEPVIGWDKEEPIKEMAKEDKSNDGKDERQPDTTPALDLTKPLQEPDLYSYTTTATLDDTTTTPAISTTSSKILLRTNYSPVMMITQPYSTPSPPIRIPQLRH